MKMRVVSVDANPAISEQRIDEQVIQIRGYFHDEYKATVRRDKLRLKAGSALIELRADVEQSGQDWWSFYADKFSSQRSRKDAEKQEDKSRQQVAGISTYSL
jgi:hypothetical protein